MKQVPIRGRLRVEMIAFISNIFASTHCICSLRDGVLKDYIDDLECTKCRARKIREALGLMPAKKEAKS